MASWSAAPSARLSCGSGRVNEICTMPSPVVSPNGRTIGPGSEQALVALDGVLHPALGVVGVAAAGHRVAPSSSRLVAGLSYPSALTTTPSRPLPLVGGRFIEPKVPSVMAASSGCG